MAQQGCCFEGIDSSIPDLERGADVRENLRLRPRGTRAVVAFVGLRLAEDGLERSEIEDADVFDLLGERAYAGEFTGRWGE